LDEIRGAAAELSEAQLLEIYEWMLTGRTLDGALLEGYRAGLVAGLFYPGAGQEAAQVGAAFALERGDVLAAGHRDLLAALVRGATLEQVLLELFGKAAAPSGGHLSGAVPCLVDRGLLSPPGDSAGAAALAVGAALAFETRAEARVALSLTGEGATATGTWHEAVNTAAVLGLPVVFVVENNQYAYSMPNRRQARLAYAAHRADGYGLPGVVVDGNDALEVYAAVGEAVEQARAGGGPSLVEAVTFRQQGHDAADPAAYVDAELRRSWEAKDPLPRLEEYLGTRGLLDEARRERLTQRVRARVEKAVSWAREQADPDPEAEIVVWAAPAPFPDPPAPAGPELTMAEALGATLSEEMARDESVVVLGADVGALGGPFGVTRGLLERYGERRVVEVPAAGPGLVGAAVGAARLGLQPVAELGYGDQFSAGLALLASHGARARWAGGGSAPLVLRVPCGAGVRAGPHRSGSPEAEAARQPGLKVVVPATPFAARGLLAAAIRDPDPVVFLEPRRLYPLAGPVPPGGHPYPLGRARQARAGEEVTVVAWGAMVAAALEAAQAAEEAGTSVEVIDLQTLAPLDWEAVFSAVSRTGRLVVAADDLPFAGIAAEIAARVAAEVFWDLDGPVLRVGPAPVSVPSSSTLEDAYLPGRAGILDAVLALSHN
jgi:2-oxoisovalerate dehydrogenase E1 component